LLLDIFQFTKEFSKEYKYTVGESLKKETIELLTLIYRANTRHQKADVLQMAREQIEVIRLLIRVMKDMKQISLEKLVKNKSGSRKCIKTIKRMAKKSKIKVFRQSCACYGIDERAILNPVTRWHCKSLQYPKQVDVSYKRLYCLQMQTGKVCPKQKVYSMHSPILVCQ
jgi:hypothetical protein